jgi:hypothetical protein
MVGGGGGGSTRPRAWTADGVVTSATRLTHHARRPSTPNVCCTKVVISHGGSYDAALLEAIAAALAKAGLQERCGDLYQHLGRSQEALQAYRKARAYRCGAENVATRALLHHLASLGHTHTHTHTLTCPCTAPHQRPQESSGAGARGESCERHHPRGGVG